MTALEQLDAVLSILSDTTFKVDIDFIKKALVEKHNEINVLDIPSILDQLKQDQLINIDTSDSSRQYYSIAFKGKYVIENGGYFESARKEAITSDLEQKMIESDIGANKSSKTFNIVTAIISAAALTVSVIAISVGKSPSTTVIKNQRQEPSQSLIKETQIHSIKSDSLGLNK